MFNFPFFGYPYNHPYYRYYNRYNYNIKDTTNNIQTKNEEKKDSITNSKEISNTINSRNSSNSSNSEQAIFEIFGIKLYLDDLIILGVLFFLYQQNVNDEMLYIILFLLLFS